MSSVRASMKLHSTTGLCATCKRAIPAELWRENGQIVIKKTCEAHGAQTALICSSADWYEETLAFGAHLVTPPGPRAPIEHGCPFDCGSCESHEQRNHLPVVPITSACNLDCPICYTHNKNGDGAYHMEEAELAAILGHLRKSAPEKRIINITGGEPTLHPNFLRLLEMCREEGIRRITLSTHGLGINDAMAAKLKEIDVRVVLSFDSFREETNKAMLGGAFGAGKMRALAALEKHDVDTSLLPVLARGVNADETGDLVALALSKDFIRSVEFHPMTFTGQYGASFDRASRYTAYDALVDLETRTDGLLRIGDFVPSPAAHPLCYQVAYLLRIADGRWIPFARFMPRAEVRETLIDTLYILPGRRVEERLARAIDGLWSGEREHPDANAILAALREMIDGMSHGSDEERMRIAERNTKAIYVHTHMDEETFDTDRIKQCCVAMPDAKGGAIPSCAYNILYRERDPRFIEAPREALVTLGRGRAYPSVA